MQIYQELAGKLLGWRDKQNDLIEILRAAAAEGHLVGNLEDRDQKGRRFPLTVMDPFTFFATFNRKVGDKSRLGILKIIKEKVGIESPLPIDFNGLPIMSAMKAWFFSFEYEREKDAISSLWDFATAIVTQKPESVPEDLFGRCLGIRNVGLANLTMGMFWMRPDVYVALDSRNRAYLSSNAIKVSVKDWKSYMALREKIKAKFPGDGWPEISAKAYKASTEDTATEALAPQTARYWMYAPGPRAVYWDEFHTSRIMALGWDNVGDLSAYSDRDAIQRNLQKVYPRKGSPNHDSLALWEFSRVMKPGDVVIAKEGQSKFVGYGIVESEYYYQAQRPHYRHVRRVNWVKRGDWSSGARKIVTKTLTDITKYPSYVAELTQLIGIDGADMSSSNDELLPSKNIILYGPPGTGKTYKVRNEYMELFTDRQAIPTAEDRATELVRDLTWWEVVAIALLDQSGNRAKVKDILDHPIVKARLKLASNRSPANTIWVALQTHTKDDCPHVKYAGSIQPLIFWKDENSVWSIDAKLVNAEMPGLRQKLDAFHKPPAADEPVRRYRFTTFHQSFSYEDFIEGIKPQMGNLEEGQLAYEIRDGILKEIVKEAITNQSKPYALFIDEINRGNVASIFGELITLIEDDKRLGAENRLTATLPYSREEFGVPSNLYIIGTMNTADRSVEALDTALRRRFTFREMRPERSLVPEISGLQIDLRRLFDVVNSRIARLMDTDHCIGHAYFMEITDIHSLRRVFQNKIIPLLREYFYGNPGKIGMVLGEHFVSRLIDKVAFASGAWGIDELDDKEVYSFSDVTELKEEDFASIYAEASPSV